MKHRATVLAYINRRTDEQRARQAAWARAKYDRDPLHRIGKNLRDRSRRRAETIARRKQATPTEGG